MNLTADSPDNDHFLRYPKVKSFHTWLCLPTQKTLHEHVRFDRYLIFTAIKHTVFVFNVEKPVDEVRAAGEVLGHVVEPVCVNLCDQTRFPLDLQRHPERVEPQRGVDLLCVVVQGEQLHPCRRKQKSLSDAT